MKKLLKKLLAPLIREVIAEELKEVRPIVKELLKREAARQLSEKKSIHIRKLIDKVSVYTNTNTNGEEVLERVISILKKAANEA
uniref:hypothetical protein n=1 Tax=Capnocytophaga leadbetteri TaxID=327575 RepID=UPI0028D51CA0|nr:hypothetical protein [Capnocytophaga leadbetteri]